MDSQNFTLFKAFDSGLWKNYGFFICTRGVRQWDPLSQLVFCIAKENLSCSLIFFFTNDSIPLLSIGRGVNIPSHLLYADDILIFFCKGSKRNI